ncbi:unnamed protein product [Effrenium voratum]|nr:unnamed protein product [Effrenium voratum]
MAVDAADWDPALILDDIDTVRARYQTQVDAGTPSPKLQWELACLLSCSPRYAHVGEAVFLFNELIEVGFERAHCLHRLILANMKLGNYSKAKEAADVWLHLEPENSEARILYSLVLERASHDGWLGYCALTLVAAGILVAWFRRK